MSARILTLGIKAEVLQLTFTAGAIFGMLAMSVLLTVPRVLLIVLTAKGML